MVPEGILHTFRCFSLEFRGWRRKQLWSSSVRKKRLPFHARIAAFSSTSSEGESLFVFLSLNWQLLDTSTLGHTHTPPNDQIFQGWKLSYYAFLFRMQRVGKKKSPDTWYNEPCIETVNSFRYLRVCSHQILLGNRERVHRESVIICLSCCFQQSRGGEINDTVNIIFLYIQ